MVFERIVVELVNRFLGDYIENLDTSQLSLSILRGDVVLNNLFVKENLLNELDLPVKVSFGNLGKLTLKIPWKSLYTEPTVAQLDGLFVIVVPNTSVKYNEEKEQKAKWDTKQKELANIEEAKKREAEKDVVKDPAQDTFVEKLIANIIKNLEVTVTNIHVRFEDNVTNPKKPFSVGVTLRELSLRTTDENWQLAVIKEAAAVIFKLVKLDSLAVYWNCSSECFGSREKSTIQPALIDTIASDNKKVDFLYLIEPMMFSARLQLNMKPEQSGYIMPKILLNAVFGEILVALAKSQYQILMEFIESLERMTLADKFRKYHPSVPKKQHYKEWWKFAQTCVLEETVRRRRKMWSWEVIRAHRQLCAKYRDLYKSKLLANKPSSQLLADLEECERELDVFNITMMRQQADAMFQKEGGKKSGSSGGWFGGWFGWGSKEPTPSESKSVTDKVQEAMTAEEKAKLYAAIGYQESGADAIYPKEFVAVKLKVWLKAVGIMLRDTELKQPHVLKLQLSEITADVSQRPAADALCVQATLQSLSILGLPELDATQPPTMVSSQGETVGTAAAGALFVDVLFETNPLDGECDTRIRLSVRPLETTFHAKTVNCLAEFFKPPDEVYVVQLQAAAMAKLESVKQQSATGMQYALEQKKYTEISVSLQPNCIIIPDQGVYRKDCRMLVLDLGELSIVTEKPQIRPTETDGAAAVLPIEELREKAFTKFAIQLKTVQLLYVGAGEQWLEARKSSSTDMHVLKPMALSINLFQCMLASNDLPKMRVNGVLPSLAVTMSDSRLCDILSLVSSIPLPQGAPPPVDEDEDLHLAKAPDAKLLPIREDAEELVSTLNELDTRGAGDAGSVTNATTAELRFEIKEISLTVAQRQGKSDVPTLKLVLESLGVKLTARDFDTSVSAYLGGIYVQHMLFKEFDQLTAWQAGSGIHAVSDGPLINLINTPIMDGEAFKLLTVEVLMANKNHPEFATTYRNTLQKISVEFTVLEVLLHQEALLSTMQMMMEIQKAIEKSKPPADVQPSARPRRQSVVSSVVSSTVSSTVKKIGPRRARRKKPEVEVIDLALAAKLGNLSVAVCTQDHMVTDVKITGLEAWITLQKSKTAVKALLRDVTVLDHQPNAIFPKILSFGGNDVFKLDIALNNDATEGQKYLDVHAFDVEVSLQTGRMKVVFLNKFIQNLLNFVNQFQVAKDGMIAAGSAAADRATAAAQDISSRASRVSLKVELNAPVVIIPQNSQSSNAVVVDLGQLNVSNGLQLTGAGQKSADGLPPLLDLMKVELDKLTLSRAVVEGTEIKADCQLLKPMSLAVKLTRNLSASWYRGHPDVELHGRLENFSLMISQGDLKTILLILNENLQEPGPSPPFVPPPSSPLPDSPSKTPVIPTVTEVPATVHVPATSEGTEPGVSEAVDAAREKEVYSTLKLDVTVDSIKLELFSGDSDLSAGASERDADHALAGFYLQSIVLNVKMKSDTSMNARFSLHRCELDDTRLGSDTGITNGHVLRMVGNGDKPLSATEPKNMIDVIFVQDSNSNKDIDMKLNGLNVVVSMEYLMTLKDFFLESLPPSPPVTSAPAPQPGGGGREAATPTAAAGDMTIKMAIMHPEIIIVENALSEDTNALILTVHLEATVRNSPVTQLIKGSIKGLSVISCIYAPEKRSSTQSQLLVPVDIDIHSSAPNGKNHHVEVVFMSDVIVNVSPAAIRTVTATVSAVPPCKDEDALDELQKIPKDLWAVKQFDKKDYWFLQTVSESSTEESGLAQLQREVTMIEQAADKERGEQLVLGNCRFIVKLLSGVGDHLVPFITTDMSLRNVDVRNWSTVLSMSSELTLQVVYYNEQLAVCEPLIEPVEADNRHRPWEIFFEMHQTDMLDWDEVDGEEAALPPAQMVVNIVSNDILQLTVSKTALDVFNMLSQVYGDAYRLVEVAPHAEPVAPFVIKNECGSYITVKPGSTFQLPDTASEGQLSLEPHHSLNLQNRAAESETEIVEKVSPFIAVLDNKPNTLGLTFEDLNSTRDLTVNRADKRAFSFDHQGSAWQIVAQTAVAYACRIVTLCSTVQVCNCLPYAVEIFYKLTIDANGRCGEVEPGDTVSLPCEVVYTEPHLILFKPREGSFSESEETINCKWTDKATETVHLIECKSYKGKEPSLCFVAKVSVETVFYESTMEATVKTYTITLSPTVVFRNWLPMDASCKLMGVESSSEIKAGDKMSLLNAKPGSSLEVTLNYQSTEWKGWICIEEEPANLALAAFETTKNGDTVTMDLGVHCERHATGYQQLSIYCPYWMINKTQRKLSYKASDDYIISHMADNSDIVLFLFKSSSGMAATKKKASLRIEDSEWSDRFSLDTVGSVGKVECKFKNQTDLTSDKSSKSKKAVGTFASVIGVKITLSSNSLTKIISFTPFFVLINDANFAIECREDLTQSPWLEILSHSCSPFWPVSTETRKKAVARIKDSTLETLPFDITEAHTTLLQLQHDYGGIMVDCTPVEGAIKIAFHHYAAGSAAVLLVNATPQTAIDYHQKEMKDQCRRLEPGCSALYTWQDPAGKRELIWKCPDKDKDFKDELIKDGFGEFMKSSDSALYWVSFLDGMQRVILFTEDIAIMTMAQQAGELERVEKEINVSLQGIGLSLVHDKQRKEIAYMAITSSGIMWEKEKGKRYKPVKNKYGIVLEEGYQQYLNELAVGDGKTGHKVMDKVEVDYSSTPMRMMKPHKTPVKRSFQYGFWVKYRMSQHQTQLHVMLHRLQLDNQLSGAVFPIVISSILPPKSVAIDSAPKPFTELSILIRKSDYSTAASRRCCGLLIQEFAVKVDQGFLMAVLALFSSGEASEEQKMLDFHKDCEMVDQSLMEDTVQSATAGIRHFYDELHCSPIKVHLSFSLYGADSVEDGVKSPQLQWNFLRLFLQSVGIVLTDIQDVTFKLGYFERKHTFFNQNQLTSEITRHYTQQALKQMYVLVLGLDVLGNPFGVIRGLATGIEDLFYEPYQGLIQGPEEFAEGLAIGVKSILGHAVGGAAGAVGRITGALGKGIASLTMDEEYQKKRREAINKRPADLKEGLARGGQGLVMGVVHGVTGVVTKPMEGAKQEGVGGFFKGVGKGLVGVFTRPASGVVDFASSSFEGIRRVAEVSDEVQKLRPPRYIQSDGIIRSYVYREAEGHQILQDTEKGKFASELYRGHLMSSPDGRTLLMATDKRALFIGRGDVFGQWNCNWEYTWEKLKEPPQLTPKGIQILLKERQKKLIGSGTIGKMITVLDKDRKYAEILVTEMRNAVSAVET